MINESFGFGPYIGDCRPTDNYIVVGACSDQNTAAQNEKIKKGEGISRKKKKIKHYIPSESFIDFYKKKELLEQEEIQPSNQEVENEPEKKDSDIDLWRAKKKEIITYWRKLPGVADKREFPVTADPIEYDYQGRTYNKDGVRITGSSTFINSVLPKLKDFLSYENPKTRLNLVYKETPPIIDQETAERSFSFYIQVKERGPKSKGKSQL